MFNQVLKILEAFAASLDNILDILIKAVCRKHFQRLEILADDSERRTHFMADECDKELLHKLFFLFQSFCLDGEPAAAQVPAMSKPSIVRG